MRIVRGTSAGNHLHGEGGDRLYGGAGRDFYFVQPGDLVFEREGEGFDSIESRFSYALLPGQEIEVMVPIDYDTGYDDPIRFVGNEYAQVIWGNGGANVLDGRGGADRVLGNAGDDLLRGGGGNDRLYGHFGNDTLEGGAGKDMMYGGSERDTFLFRHTGDSTPASAGRDSIQDFSQAEHDRIDLHLIDADRGSAGNQAFRFIHDAPFNGHAGELQAAAFGTQTLVSGDTTGDGRADFAILVFGNIALERGDFVL